MGPVVETAVNPGGVGPDGPDAQAWHTLPAEAVLESLATSGEGLSEPEATRRLTEYGPNSLRESRPTPWFVLLLDQVKSVVVVFLIAVSLIALSLGDEIEAAAIGAVVLINIAIGFTTEWRARGALSALLQLQVHEAVVVREGAERKIDARTLVPGDVIALHAGVAIAADGRVFEATELETNEASLTGESLPVGKVREPPPGGGIEAPELVALADRATMVYKGTLVTGGVGRAVLTATGTKTEIGRVTELVQFIENEPTPLERRLNVLGTRLIWLTLGVAAAISGLGIVQGREVWLMIETGIALAIAAVPEGLPVVATLTQAVGIRRMARRRALLRRLPAVESLGSTTVICSDKTGTLTTGRMTVTRVELADQAIDVKGVGLEPRGGFWRGDTSLAPEDVFGLSEVFEAGASTCRAAIAQHAGKWEAIGDPTEVAVLIAASKAGIRVEALDRERVELAHIPFSSERMWSGSVRNDSRSAMPRLGVLGAPDRLFELSDAELASGGEQVLTPESLANWQSRNVAMAAQGLRVLGVASANLSPGTVVDPDHPPPLTFLGLLGLQDPPAEGVSETIKRLQDAGIRTIMVTGDQPRTAQSISESLGIGEGEPLSGPVMAHLSGDELRERVADVHALARVSPEQKVQVVAALQERGEIVAMLGDGVNDAPALRKADIGVAMGLRGTDVAKETADLVLADDRFETIGAAVEEGRVIFDNVRRFIFYLFSCNASEVAVLSLAALTPLPQPLLPLQILWLNLVTDVFPALALAMEPAEEGVMERPPRDPGGAIMSRSFVAAVLSYTGLITIATLSVYFVGYFVLEAGALLTTTMTFQTLAFAQLLHVFNARSVGRLARGRLLHNPWVWSAILLTVGLQLVVVYYPPLMRILGTTPLGLEHWALIVFASFFPLVVGQLWSRRR